jgi:hypothetical protein
MAAKAASQLSAFSWRYLATPSFAPSLAGKNNGVSFSFIESGENPHNALQHQPKARLAALWRGNRRRIPAAAEAGGAGESSFFSLNQVLAASSASWRQSNGNVWRSHQLKIENRRK